MKTLNKILVTVTMLLILIGFAYSIWNVTKPKENVVNIPEPVIEVQPTTTEPIVEAEEDLEVVEEPMEYVFRVTAYCPCETCCGKWAKNRPIGEDGEPIVVGACGKELVDGFSCASPMAFGTQVEIDSLGTLEVQDRTADWIVEEHGEYILDVYMTDHNKALEFGVQYLRGVIK